MSPLLREEIAPDAGEEAVVVNMDNSKFTSVISLVFQEIIVTVFLETSEITFNSFILKSFNSVLQFSPLQ